MVAIFTISLNINIMSLFITLNKKTISDILIENINDGAVDIYESFEIISQLACNMAAEIYLMCILNRNEVSKNIALTMTTLHLNAVGFTDEEIEKSFLRLNVK